MSYSTKKWLFAALVAIFMTAFDAKADYKELWSLGAIDPDYVAAKKCGANAFVVVSWNVVNFGGNESPERVESLAKILKHSELAFVLEVSGSHQGPKAAAVLQEELSRKGSKWRIAVSDATTPEPAGKNTSERVVAYWKSHAVSVGALSAGLVKNLSGSVAREPYRIDAISPRLGKVEFFAFHARPENSGALEESILVAKEASALSLLTSGSQKSESDVGTVVLGDFNLSKQQLDRLFVPHGFTAGISGATSLRKNGDGVSRKRDNAYFRNVSVCEAGRIRTDKIFGTASVKVSDHVPVYLAIQAN